MRQALARKERNVDIVDHIVKVIKSKSKKCIEKSDPIDENEVKRRFSMLTKPFIADCLNKNIEILQNLKITVANSMLVAKTIRTMETLVFIIPEIGLTRCPFVQAKLAKIIAQVVNEIKRQRVRGLKSHSSQYRQTPTTPKKTHVTVTSTQQIIGESHYTEFIGELSELDKPGMSAQSKQDYKSNPQEFV